MTQHSARRAACGTKQRYRTPSAARWAMHRVMRAKPDNGHMQVYRCACGGWHFGHVRSREKGS